MVAVGALLGQQPPTKLEVHNRYGSIRIRVDNVRQPTIEATVGGDAAAPEALSIQQAEGLLRVLATPRDTKELDLTIVAPYGVLLEAATVAGAIEYEGYGRANLQTESGDVSLTFPAEATSFDLVAAEPPDVFKGEARVEEDGGVWSARDRLPNAAAAYGRITLRARNPGSITLTAVDGIPSESPIKPHWLARELLPRLFGRFGDADVAERNDSSSESPSESPAADFSTDVRLVQIDVSVTDGQGRPVTGLGPDDFHVEEDGKPQNILDVSRSDAPFNLVLLLDCSSSTERERRSIEQAAENFVRVARAGDKVAVYVLAETHFQSLSRLTTEFQAVTSNIRTIGLLGGATPLYDATILAYAEELAGLPQQRNALVILSDGLDNSIYGAAASVLANQGVSGTRLSTGAPSTVSFEQLHKAAQEMRALLYPIVLDPVAAIAGSQPFLLERAREWAVTVRRQARSLATATGGRAFDANSLEDLESVYDRVAQDLRSVYTISYRPVNQDFDGRWRRVKVRTDGRSLTVRSRRGFHAY